MQVICEATQNQNVHVQVSAFECLVKIMGLYYDKMALYMEQALFGVCHLIGFCLIDCLSFTDFDLVDCDGNEASGGECCLASSRVLVYCM